MDKLPNRRSSERLRLLMTDFTKYIDLLDDRDIDHLLAALAKTGGLSQQDIEDHLSEMYPSTPE